MTLLLVRHAVAVRRRDWAGPDDLRPLAPRGYRQADALSESLASYAVERILSSPYVRCLETVQPLAARLGLPVEPVAELAEGSGRAMTARGGLAGSVVLCTHGDVVPELLAALASKSVPDDGDPPCAKASTWVVDLASAEASYFPPPA